MKKLREMKKQLLGGIMMLAISVPLLLVVLSVGSVDPSLAYEGVEMRMQEDGSVQMLFEISVRDLEVRGPNVKLVGARFRLNYNPEYLTPSDYRTNRPLQMEGGAFDAFCYSPDLYKVEKDGVMVPEDPFDHIPVGKWNRVTKGRLELSIGVNLKKEKLGKNQQGLGSVWVGENGEKCYIDKTGKVVLGTLSFRVEKENLDKLPEVTRLFGGIREKQDPFAPSAASEKKYLIYYKETTPSAHFMDGDWAIEVYFPKGAEYTLGYLDNSDMARSSTLNSLYGYNPYAVSHFTFRFPKIIIGVEAAESDLTVDAYQAYRDGTVSDVDNTLQKYSPMVKVRYSDGSQKNETFPWGRAAAPWTATKVTPWADNVAWEDTAGVINDANYDCRRGDYKVQKLYCYDDGGTPRRFPLPVNVHLKVTPITLVDVTANDLERSYVLNNALVAPGGVQSLGDLNLPEEARLITDVPAGGATLTMPIPGWSHENRAADAGAIPPVSAEYWPSGSMEIRELRKDGAAEAQKEYLRWPVNADLSSQNSGAGWGTVEANGTAMGKNRAGTYTFRMAGTYGGMPIAGFARTDIQRDYPWLTIPEENYPLDNALRQIVWNDSGEGGEKKLEDRSHYTVTYVATTTNTNTLPELLLPDMTLQVVKNGEGGSLTNLPETSVFRIKLPDGTEMGIGNVGDITLDNWFGTVDSGRYEKERVDLPVAGGASVKAFKLTANPGNTGVAAYESQRERLLRYINLGGWFSVAINEDPDRNYWTDFIPVYVPPRDNHHLESKTYNFVGENADLYRFIKAPGGGFPTTVILPPGEYETVDSAGEPVYDETLGDDNVTVIDRKRHVERYGLKTLYNGVTGGQFGELTTFTITPSWTVSSEANSITRYGPNSFLDDALYGVYGRVKNPGLGVKPKLPGDTSPIEYQPETHTGEIRIQRELKNPQEERITLTYEGAQTGGINYGPDGNVDLVTYSTRTEGYTVRQEYTLTITNVGDVDIQGLAIDTLTDIDGAGGHFVLLKPPATFLPVGGSTTFTLSYEYDLRAQQNGRELEYLDKLFITSDSKKTVGPGTVEGTDYLLNFDAQFKVSGNKLHRVWVKYRPEDGGMGTAQVIVGEDRGTINPGAGSTTATQGMTVYVMATPTDEYEVRAYTAQDRTGATVSLRPYVGTVTLASGTTVSVSGTSQIRIWYFEMPDYDVTVEIDFYEPNRSKLRLSELTTYADKDKGSLEDPATNAPQPGRVSYEYKVWQKSFTTAETNAAAGYLPEPGNPQRKPTEEETGRYLMRGGAALRKGYSETAEQYLVVIPYEAEYAQVEATLRKVVQTNQGTNLNLSPVTVSMDLYPTDPLTDAPRQIYLTTGGDTAVPTVHTSRAFDAPKPGSSSYVVIRMHYNDGSTDDNRYYYVEIHRTPETPVVELNYGNSPYGMIMNAGNITGANKQKAKDAFKANRYSFSNLKAELVPEKVTEAGLERLHYWTEAWVAPDAAYEPESHMGFQSVYNSTDQTWTWVPKPDIYKEENNLDLNDYSFFAILGEDFLDPGLGRVLDSSGRPIDTSRAVLSLEAYTLDLSGATQQERFGLPVDPNASAPSAADRAALAARTVLLSRQTPANTIVRDWSSLANTGGRYLRPGRYQLVYTLPDYDYDDYYATPQTDRDPNRDPTLKVKRDFVVLAPVGDVNADLPSGQGNANSHVADRTDELLVKGRVTDPLGYMAANYADGAIFKLRTCDVNNDRNINNIDANTIRAGKVIPRYYHPINYK